MIISVVIIICVAVCGISTFMQLTYVKMLSRYMAAINPGFPQRNFWCDSFSRPLKTRKNLVWAKAFNDKYLKNLAGRTLFWLNCTLAIVFIAPIVIAISMALELLFIYMK